MATYATHRAAISSTADRALCELVTKSNKARVIELWIVLRAVATGSQMQVSGVGRPASKGIGPLVSYPLVNESDPGAANALTTMIVDWVTPPTIPANFIRRVSIADNLYTTMVWTFPRGVGIPTNSSLVVWQIGATRHAMEVMCVIDE